MGGIEKPIGGKGEMRRAGSGRWFFSKAKRVTRRKIESLHDGLIASKGDVCHLLKVTTNDVASTRRLEKVSIILVPLARSKFLDVSSHNLHKVL